MKAALIVLAVVVIGAVRVWVFVARRRRRRSSTVPGADVTASPLRAASGRFERVLGDVGLVASREVKERLHGRIFRFGTVALLLAVGAAVVIPALHKSGNGKGLSLQKVGVVGTMSAETKQLVLAAAAADQDRLVFVPETSLAEAKADLKSGRTYLSILGTHEVLTYLPASSSKSPADANLVADVAEYLGVVNAYKQAHLTPGQAATVTSSKSVPVRTLAGSPKSSTPTTSIIGLVLLFFMLTQYCSWILIGVMQEKSSRVVEVLLAMVRPIQLLGGKVLGIGLVALGQAAVVVGFALALGAAVGSDLLKGTAPESLLAELLWLVLGYAFYCWVYAAAGSTAERQDQVQTLALPLSVPILLAYIYSITVASTGHPSVLFDVLAYLPPTAPFCMSVLVGLHTVAWWQFTASALISVACTAGVAVFAAGIYKRAILRTGRRPRLRELVGRAAPARRPGAPAPRTTSSL